MIEYKNHADIRRHSTWWDKPSRGPNKMFPPQPLRLPTLRASPSPALCLRSNQAPVEGSHRTSVVGSGWEIQQLPTTTPTEYPTRCWGRAALGRSCRIMEPTARLSPHEYDWWRSIHKQGRCVSGLESVHWSCVRQIWESLVLVSKFKRFLRFHSGGVAEMKSTLSLNYDMSNCTNDLQIVHCKFHQCT